MGGEVHDNTDQSIYVQGGGKRAAETLRLGVGSLVIFVPVQPLLVELDHNLWDLQICLFGWHQICLIRPLPLDEEVELSWVIGCSNDLFCSKTPGKSFRPCVRFLGRLGLGLSRVCSSLPFATSRLLVVTPVLLLVLLDQLMAFQVANRLPRVVVRVLPSLPLHKVLSLALSQPLADNGLNLIFFSFRHDQLSFPLLRSVIKLCKLGRLDHCQQA